LLPCSAEDEKNYLPLLEKQDNKLVSPALARKFTAEAVRNWDLFYKRNASNFFKDRHYLRFEFVELYQTCNDWKVGNPQIILSEIGCGVGNTMFPLLKDNPALFAFGIDCSTSAIQQIKKNSAYEDHRCKLWVCDLTEKEPPPEIRDVDFATLIFVLSALHPSKMLIMVKAVFSMLRPGGMLYFRDYGVFDMSQVRFAPGSKIGPNFYVRQDGTTSYFFSREEVSALFESVGFVVKSAVYHRKEVVNRKTKRTMKRTWLQVKCCVPS